MGSGQSVHASYEPGQFHESRAWRRVQSFLAGSGGTVAVVGPRGCGKTWLLHHAQTAADRSGAYRLFYSSPSEHDSASLLISLTDALATSIIDQVDKDRIWLFRPANRRALIRMLLMLLVFAVVVWPAWSLFRLGSDEQLCRATYFEVFGDEFLFDEGPASDRFLTAQEEVDQLCGVSPAAAITRTAIAPGFLAVVSLVLAPAAFLAFTGSLSSAITPLGQLRSSAVRVQSLARYSATLREASGFEAAGGGPLRGLWRRTRETSLAQRPLTLSSLTEEFRRLATLASETAVERRRARKGSAQLRGALVGNRQRPLDGTAPDLGLVIAIDELDRLRDAETFRKVLQDIKPVFEVPAVHAFVSISLEAADRFQLALVGQRDEFTSTFDTVLECERFGPERIRQILSDRLGGRDVPIGPAAAIAIMSGGILRDVIRLAENPADHLLGEGLATEDTLAELVRREADLMRTVVVRSWSLREVENGRGARTDDALLDTLQDLQAVRSLIEISPELIAELWDASHERLWPGDMLRHWQAFLVRVFVAKTFLAKGPDSSEHDRVAMTLELQSVVSMSAVSPTFARDLLSGYLRVGRSPLQQTTSIDTAGPSTETDLPAASAAGRSEAIRVAAAVLGSLGAVAGTLGVLNANNEPELETIVEAVEELDLSPPRFGMDAGVTSAILNDGQLFFLDRDDRALLEVDIGTEVPEVYDAVEFGDAPDGTFHKVESRLYLADTFDNFLVEFDLVEREVAERWDVARPVSVVGGSEDSVVLFFPDQMEVELRSLTADLTLEAVVNVPRRPNSAVVSDDHLYIAYDDESSSGPEGSPGEGDVRAPGPLPVHAVLRVELPQGANASVDEPIEPDAVRQLIDSSGPIRLHLGGDALWAITPGKVARLNLRSFAVTRTLETEGSRRLLPESLLPFSDGEENGLLIATDRGLAVLDFDRRVLEFDDPPYANWLDHESGAVGDGLIVALSPDANEFSLLRYCRRSGGEAMIGWGEACG